MRTERRRCGLVHSSKARRPLPHSGCVVRRQFHPERHSPTCPKIEMIEPVDIPSRSSCRGRDRVSGSVIKRNSGPALTYSCRVRPFIKRAQVYRAVVDPRDWEGSARLRWRAVADFRRPVRSGGSSTHRPIRPLQFEIFNGQGESRRGVVRGT